MLSRHVAQHKQRLKGAREHADLCRNQRDATRAQLELAKEELAKLELAQSLEGVGAAVHGSGAQGPGVAVHGGDAHESLPLAVGAPDATPVPEVRPEKFGKKINR